MLFFVKIKILAKKNVSDSCVRQPGGYIEYYSHGWSCRYKGMELISELQMSGDSRTPELVWDLSCEIEIQEQEVALD